ncbi:antibiotic biosynthesis monooxygenase [Myceligenerans pegani]|uniref:Antibiotic biosynthesis monooxygenase n=1 Tax=Myceligenerans pegani TaxID=2776917 RepID=A0ABR9N0R8_9MICO|nr:antibiotic biosynthesis monooxygenase [Myceligenerans sp. TRM 65318]MBE1877265.1 antibiotic biosynthesis monooxygenase [Myceligenerans sp. TRM 65318]MBE3019536.1 antibiotic biosynthesis monooxygenase [Myceligenerans sp. TRM 65318]
MYVRTSEVRGDPAMLDEGLRLVREEIYPTVTAMDGCAGMSVLYDRDICRVVATTSWRSEDAMRASADAVRPLRERAERALGGTGGSEVHQWEVAVVHHDHPVPDGAWARLTWLTCDPGMIDHAIDLFRMAALPQIQEFDGFCGASLMVDRGAGRIVGTAAFDGLGGIEASRDMAADVRERIASEVDATVEGVEEMEVAFAHLHVPEMA